MLLLELLLAGVGLEALELGLEALELGLEAIYLFVFLGE
jgi:hypothetical protein